MKIKGKEWSQEDIKYLHEHTSEKQDFCKALGYADGKHYGRIIERLKLNKEDFGKYAENFYGKSVHNGDTFNMLTIIEANCEQNLHGDQKSLCRCECGEEIIARNADLKNGNSKSCGCLNGHNAKNKIINGQSFGKLTVTNANCSYSKNTTRPWLMSECTCECGSKILVRNCSLRQNHVLSCGCIKSHGEVAIEQILKNLGIVYKKQYYFEDLIGDTGKPLFFDFVIFANQKIKFAIEYQGRQHYQPIEFFGGEEKFNKQKKYDNKKREYCKKNNIILIEIPYTDYKKMDEDYIKSLVI